MLIHFFFLIFLFFSSSLFSETLIFKDGSYINCRIKNQNVQRVIYEYKGKTHSISKTKVLRIVYTNDPQKAKKEVETELIKLRKNLLKQKKESETKKKKEQEEKEKEETRKKEEELQNKLTELQKRLEELEQKGLSETEEHPQEDKFVKNTSEEISALKVEIEDLKKRTTRIEKYLELEPDLKDYYGKQRSPWSLVWRSALFPGWGHSYVRKEEIGITYTTLFLSLLVIGGGIYDSGSTALKAASNKEQTDLVQTHLLMNLYEKNQQALLAENPNSTSITAISSSDIFSLTFFPKYLKTKAARNTASSLQAKGRATVAAAFGIYFIQIVHAYITGVYWSKRPAILFEEYGSLQPSGFQFSLNSDSPQTTKQEQNYSIHYNYKF
ncbi:MAG: hypothetical protein H7A25_19065 [Leptospiraceae bacterium]|nr:hypothetical protein [Leptospiraceae bacterium]